MEDVLLTIILPVYNAETFLRECLDSVCKQTLSNFEVLCIDDGSTDSSGAILDEYGAKDSRFKVFHRPNSGAYVSRNFALDQARGVYVIGLDADDILVPECYEKALGCMSQDVDMVYFGTEPFGEDHKQIAWMKTWTEFTFPKEEIIPLTGKNNRIISGYFWNKIYKRDLIEKYQIRFPIKSPWLGDIAFSQKYAAVARCVYMLPDKLYRYRIHSSSILGHSRAGSLKNLGVCYVIDDVYAWYKKLGVWEQFLPSIEHWANFVSKVAPQVPKQYELRSRIFLRNWIHKWKLYQYFPNNPKIQQYAELDALDVIDEFVLQKVQALGGTAKRRDTVTETQKYQQLNYVVKYGFCKELPILSIRCSWNPRTDIMKKRIKLFGFFPLIMGKGREHKMHWRLFNFIPVWRAERFR